jgi:hypothetical protein
MTTNKEVENLKKEIEDLKSELIKETMVKKSEVILNKELLQEIEKNKLHIQTLQKINEEYSNTISKLNLIIKKNN